MTTSGDGCAQKKTLLTKLIGRISSGVEAAATANVFLPSQQKTCANDRAGYNLSLTTPSPVLDAAVPKP